VDAALRARPARAEKPWAHAQASKCRQNLGAGASPTSVHMRRACDLVVKILLDLMGGVALLMWGLHMVRSGIVRAFGSDLRRGLGWALRNRVLAFGAGVGVTAMLQSSTATGLMVASFVARLRLPLGNLINRAVGCAVVLPLLRPITAVLTKQIGAQAPRFRHGDSAVSVASHASD
jgi:Na+/phosphate symporter